MAGHRELVERDAAEQGQPDRGGDQQQEEVEEPLEVPLRGRHRLRQQQHERQAADLAQPVEPEERLAPGDPQQGGDVEPVEPPDGAGVPLVEPGRGHQQHVAGARLPGHLHHRPGVVDLGDDDELGDVGREVAPGEVEVDLLPRQHHPGQPLAPGAQGVREGPVDRHRHPGEHDHRDEVGDGEGQRPPDRRAPLAEQAAQGEVEQGDEAARGQRQPGRPGQDGRPTQAGLTLVEPTEVEGEDEDEGGDAEREQVGAQRVRRPGWRAVAHHHAQHRQPEDRQPVEEHDEPEAAPVEPSDQRGDGTPVRTRVAHRRLRLSRAPHPDAGRPGSGRPGRRPRRAPRATPRARGRRRRRRPRGR